MVFKRFALRVKKKTGELELFCIPCDKVIGDLGKEPAPVEAIMVQADHYELVHRIGRRR